MHIRTITKACPPMGASDFSDTLDLISQILTVMATTVAAVASIQGLVKGLTQ